MTEVMALLEHTSLVSGVLYSLGFLVGEIDFGSLRSLRHLWRT